MGFKDTDPCIKKALKDELLFTLMARDETAPETVCDWITRNLRIQSRERLHEALDAALTMIETRLHIKDQIIINKVRDQNQDQCCATSVQCSQQEDLESFAAKKKTVEALTEGVSALAGCKAVLGSMANIQHAIDTLTAERQKATQ